MRRTTALVSVSALLLAFLTACGHAKAGTALPKGDDAAAYVTAKFDGAMKALTAKLGNERNISASVDSYFRIDDKWDHTQLTASRLGEPEARIVQQHSLRDPDETRDDFSPASGSVDYIHLGKHYSSLAPTPWVSMPKKPGGNGPICAWLGTIEVCNMVDAVLTSVEANKAAVISARSQPSGETELVVNVTLDAILKEHVEILPDALRSKITEAIRHQIIITKVTIEADSTVKQISMNGTLDKDSHHIEMSQEFHFTGEAKAQDFPSAPDASQVTVLPDQAAVADFNRRTDELQNHVS
jgi:hypothetical protein